MTKTIEFGSRTEAKKVRENRRYKPLLADSDDKRTATVQLKDSAPRSVISEVTGEAAESREREAEKFGQVPLSDRERDQIDFSETTVPEARSAKGIALGKGVDDFTSFFDETLTVDEHREVFESAKTEGGGTQNRGRETGNNAKRLAQANKRRKEQAGGKLRDFALTEADEDAQAELEETGSLGADFDIGFNRTSGGRLLGTGQDFDRLLDRHEDRSQRAQTIDEKNDAPVTRDPVEWANNPSELDYPGIDTVQPQELHNQRSDESQSVDERELAPKADTKEEWAQNPDQFDWPGVDTPPTMGLGGNEPDPGPVPDTGTDREEPSLAKLGPGMQDDPTDSAGFFLTERDVSASPEELTDGVGLGQSSAPGGPAYDAGLGRPVETDRTEQEQQPPQEAINSQSDSGPSFSDDRAREGSLASFGMETDGTVYREARQDEESASTFGVDDRSAGAVGSDDSDDSEQQGFEVFGGGVRENQELF